MREIIAQHVINDKEKYNEAILGRSNPDYCDWIRKSSSWGGAIEVSILSNYYGIEIDVVDITNALINRFGEDKEFGMRAFLLFDGIHYDPLYLESIIVRFSTNINIILHRILITIEIFYFIFIYFKFGRAIHQKQCFQSKIIRCINRLNS